MDPSSLPKLSALLTLGHGAAFALDLEEWSFGVVAGGSSVSFDAGFTGGGGFSAKWRGGGMSGVPCKLLVVDVNLLESRRE